MMRRWLAGVAAGLGVYALGPTPASAGPAVVFSILAGAHEGRLQVEIRGSEPLSYLLVEGVEPFSVSVLFLNATFGFPAEERGFPGPGLKKIRTSVLERDGSRLGRLDLMFDGSATHQIIKEGRRLLLRVDTPAPRQGFVLAGTPQEPPTPPGGSAPRALRQSPPRILKVVPEIADGEVRVVVEADGPLAHRSFTLEKPFRVVVDLEGARFPRREETVDVGNALLRRIRSSQFSPTAVRVVLDLARPGAFRVEARDRGVVIHLGRASGP